MNCLNPSCKSPNLLCRIQAVLMAPLAQRGGSVVMKGIAVGQKDVKGWWDKRPSGGKQMIRGPIICAECDTEHVYLVGLQPSLRMITHEEAVANGYDHYAANSEKSTEDDDQE